MHVVDVNITPTMVGIWDHGCLEAELCSTV